MNRDFIRLPFFILLALFIAVPPAFAHQPTWAKKAVAFESMCREKQDWPHCKPVRIPSPDGQNRIEVFYKQPFTDDKLIRDTKVAYLKIVSAEGQVRETTLPDGFEPIDLLWSPDSKAFFVNGGNGGGYWGFWVFVYRIADPELEPIDITQNAHLDMVKTFPPCKATFLDEKTCHVLEKEPDSNMSGIDWAPDSSAIIAMAEVPCSGGHGGIMCQVMGYKIEVPTGKIRERLVAPEFKRLWQKSMAFKFRVPDPPDYRTEK